MPVIGCSTLLLLLILDQVLSVRQCPPHCLCYETSELVDCRFGGLIRVPSGISHGTWLLDLSGNKLIELHTRSFMGLWSLKILLLSNNSIQTLQPQSLSSLQFLERLDLSYNRLRRLPRDFSRGLSSLQELHLDHNLLQHLDSYSLSDLENLRKLDLSYNGIRTMDVGAFSGLVRLSLLNLDGNFVNVLKDGLLSRQQGLEVLLLGHSNISAIETEALAPLRRLTLLGLQGNRLKNIRFKTFLKLRTASTTTHLQLAFNPWSCDCELHRVFSKIQRVRRLNVFDYKDIVCHAPPQLAGLTLASVESHLCLAETASVLAITITVLLAVIGALIKAEHDQSNKQAANEADSDRQNK